MDTLEQRRRCATAQGLDTRADEPLAATLERSGWVRTLGGAAGYLALSARNDTVTADGVHQAVADGELCVVPAARGCIYLVPASQVGLALRLSAHLALKRLHKDLHKANADLAAVRRTGEAVLEALATSAISTRGLRKALPDDVVISLGPAGKKVGLTSTLPPALRLLEFEGRISRVPLGSRLDHEQYDWRLADDEVGDFTAADAVTLAGLFARWTGVTTRQELAKWTGLKQSEAKAALKALDPDMATVDGDDLVGPADPTACPEVWLPGMDNFYALRGRSDLFVDPDDADIEATVFGSRPQSTLAEMRQPIDRTIVRDGRVVGLWTWDPTAEEVVHHCWDGEADLDEAERVATLIQDVGTSGVFSLDSADRQQRRADRIRAL